MHLLQDMGAVGLAPAPTGVGGAPSSSSAYGVSGASSYRDAREEEAEHSRLDAMNARPGGAAVV